MFVDFEDTQWRITVLFLRIICM